MMHASVTIQITPESQPATPAWIGEVAAFAQVLAHTGMLESIQEQVRFARAHFGQYDLIDFVAVLIGYVLSEEATLLAFYQRLAPFAEPFMALLKPRRVSTVLWPCSSSSSDASPLPDTTPALLPAAPVLWRDWPRCSIRRTWLARIRCETVEVTQCPSPPTHLPIAQPSEAVLTRAERAHWRLSWQQRLSRNRRPALAPAVTITLHGLPATFASSFGFNLLATA